MMGKEAEAYSIEDEPNMMFFKTVDELIAESGSIEAAFSTLVAFRETCSKDIEEIVTTVINLMEILIQGGIKEYSFVEHHLDWQRTQED